MVLRGIDMVDKLKGIKEGDYVRIQYKNGEVKEGFYKVNVNKFESITYYKKGFVEYKGVYLFMADNSDEHKSSQSMHSRYENVKRYVIECIKNDEGRWVGSFDRIDKIDYIQENTESERDYIIFESYLKSQSGDTNTRFNIEDWERLIKRVGVSDDNIEEFIERVERYQSENGRVEYK